MRFAHEPRLARIRLRQQAVVRQRPHHRVIEIMLGKLEILAIRARDHARREMLGDGIELLNEMAGIGHGGFLLT